MVLTQRHRRNSPKSEDASMSTNDARKRTQKRHTSYTLSVIALVVGPCLVMFSFQVPLELQDRHQEESRLRRIASLSSKIPQSREEQSRNGVVIARPSSSAAKEETTPPIPPPLKRVLTVYSEPPTTLVDHTPLERHTSASKLSKTEYPDFGTDCGYVHNFPIDDFVDTDPFLPWIHDYFVQDGHVKFVAQNKRRCETGEGKDIIMKFREPQMALFQPVSVKEERSQNGTILYKLSSPEEATYPETRFLCHFTDAQNKTYTTFSVYPFNYEYIHWRKRAMFKNTKAMFRFSGRDIEFFEFSQLLFSCPLPVEATDQPLWLDLVPIRTPARTKPLLTKRQVGSTEFAKLERFNTTLFYGDNHILPAVHDSGRWSNLPICARREQPPKQLKPQHRFVACTWTAASYHRRGDIAMVSDSEQRLTEWIVFHRLVGVDHIYLYDNSQGPETLRSVAERFSDFVTYIEWPATVCSNNRPNHKNPGERSSQYAAEASCRERFGSNTEWMTFIDTDEYLVPLQGNSWHAVFDSIEPDVHVLKMRSTRGKPRVDLMEAAPDQSVCENPNHRKERLPIQPCVVPRRNETFLRVYNCDFIKPPRPDRFARAMKQIYRPSFVLSHFVHYSTVTTGIARFFEDVESSNFTRAVQPAEWGDKFLDELNEGILIHTKSVLPHETAARDAACRVDSRNSCQVGIECPESTPFVDEEHKKNVFTDAKGNFCNCWINPNVEALIPRLEEEMRRVGGQEVVAMA